MLVWKSTDGMAGCCQISPDRHWRGLGPGKGKTVNIKKKYVHSCAIKMCLFVKHILLNLSNDIVGI